MAARSAWEERLPSEIVPIIVGTITWRYLIVKRSLLAVVHIASAVVVCLTMAVVVQCIAVVRRAVMAVVNVVKTGRR